MKRDLPKGSFLQQWVRLQPLNLSSFKVYSSVSYWLPDSPMGCYKPNLYEMLSLNDIDSSILSICLILWFFAVKKEIKGILEQERIRILQIVKPFFSPCLLKLFLNNRLMSNTLVTEIDKSCKYFPLTSYYIHWAQNWPIVCDAYNCKIFYRTRKNFPMNSIILRRNGSRNEASFHNLSQCSTTHCLISFTLKKHFKIVEIVE